MGFLDKINSGNTALAEAPKKVNPLLRKKVEAPKAVETSAEAPKKKGLPLKPKAKVEAPPVKEEAVVQPAEAETVEAAVVEETLEEAAVPVEVPEVTTPEEAVVEAESPAEPEPAEEVKAEPVVEEKPAPKKNNNKKKPAAKKQEKSADPFDPEDDYVDIPRTNMSFAEAVTAIRSSFVDEEWEAFKAEVDEELSAIVVNEDLNPGTLKVTISELSILREKVWLPFQEAKTMYDSLASKEPEGLIERVKRINIGSGNNDMERRKAGVLACMNYKTDAGDINLFEMLDEARARYNFLKTVIDSIKYKTDVLITMNGALKLERDHS